MSRSSGAFVRAWLAGVVVVVKSDGLVSMVSSWVAAAVVEGALGSMVVTLARLLVAAVAGWAWLAWAALGFLVVSGAPATAHWYAVAGEPPVVEKE